jgi:hypothetical protein
MHYVHNECPAVKVNAVTAKVVPAYTCHQWQSTHNLSLIGFVGKVKHKKHGAWRL